MNLSSDEKKSIRLRYLDVDTSNVADVLDVLGCPHQALAADFLPYPATTKRMAGWAYTIQGQMAPYPLGGDAEKMEACQGLGDGEIGVWGGDSQGICYFGELIAIGMKEHGCVGALVDGGIRDVRWIGHHEFPIFARYRTPVQSIGRWKVTSWQKPVFLEGATSKLVTVAPGDFILADEDGAIVVPQHLAESVLIEAERLTAVENNIRQELTAGLTLAEALRKYGHV